MSSLIFSNPTGAVPPYKNLFSSVTTVPPNTSLAFISTQWAGDKDGNVLFPNDYRAQSKVIAENVVKILEEMGCGFKDIILRKMSVVDFNDDIGKEMTEASIEAVPDDQKEFMFKSSFQFCRTPGFHKDGIVVSLDLIVAVPTK